MHSGPARLLLIVVLGAAPFSARCEDDTQACRSGRGDDRIAACTRLIGNAGASPTDRASALENRAKAYASDSRYADVVADLDRAIEYEPTIPRYRERGFGYYFTDKHAQAIADFDRVVAADPDDDFVLTFRAKTYLKMGDADRAIADLGQAIAVAPGKPDAYVARAEVYRQTKAYMKALPDLDKAISLEPTRVSTYLARAEVHHKLGIHDLAVADLTHVIKLDPDDPSGYLNRALMYEDRGNVEAAVADYDKLISLRPDDVWYRNRRQALIAKTGQTATPPPAVPSDSAPATVEREATARKVTPSAPAPDAKIDCKAFMPAVNIVITVPCRD